MARKPLLQTRCDDEWQQFVDFLQQAASEGKLEQFFAMLLTSDERASLGLRVQIVRELLKQENTQREIQHKLNTSAATITRGSNMLKQLEPEFIAWVDGKLNGKEKEEANE